MPKLDANGTTDDVLRGVDLSGKRALVTGASGGLGRETARALAAAGATVVLAARSVEKTNAAVQSIREDLPAAALESRPLDLASLASVRHFAARLVSAHDRLDFLINNAGVMATPFGHTTDGFELQIGTNHLGHFLLTGLIAPALLAAAPSRIVNVASGGHLISDIHWDDPNFARHPYEKWTAYGQSSVARNATAVTGPTPGVVASRRATGSPASRRATRASAAAMAALSGLSRATSGAIRAAGGRGTQLERVRVARPGGPPHRRDPAVPDVARHRDQGPGRSGPARALARVPEELGIARQVAR